MSEMENEVPMMVTEEHFEESLTKLQKHRLYKDIISLEVSVMVIRYDPGRIPLIVFMEKVDSSFSENARYAIAMKMLVTIEPDIPKYHTLAMRKEFKKTTDILSADIKPHQLRYSSLTGDCSAENMAHEIDERLQLAIDTEDPDLVIDLRELNRGRPADTFDVFSESLNVKSNNLLLPMNDDTELLT